MKDVPEKKSVIHYVLFFFQPPWLLDRLGEVRGKILVFSEDVNRSGDTRLLVSTKY